jgi:superfamily II DNA/RNA helicase
MAHKKVRLGYAPRAAALARVGDGAVRAAMEGFDREEWGISDNVLRGVYCQGFEKPSAIQGRAIGPLLGRKDVIAQDRSGSGKTGAFLIAMIELAARSARGDRKGPRFVVACHTRELASQTLAIAASIAQYSDLSAALVTGGAPLPRADAVDILIATPGKLATASGGPKPRVSLASVECLVIDEVDEMFKQTGKNSCLAAMTDILSCIPPGAQLALFSATMSDEVRHITETLLRDPVELLLDETTLSVEGIEQYHLPVSQSMDIPPAVVQILSSVCSAQTMVFCATGDEAAALGAELERAGVACAVLYSGIGSEARQKEMRRFREGGTGVMVSTPVLSRGVDVQQVSLVILASVPAEPDTYLHSVGRCGRYGRRGVSVALTREYDMPTLRAVERSYGCTIAPWGVSAQ